MGRVRMPIGVLNHFTATCGQDIFRGHGLPDDLRGDLLFAEPVGRLVRRAKVSVSQGLTRLENAYPGSEFITSTDPLFRPVNMTTAPDGTIYIVGHVPRHHPGSELDAEGQLPPQEDRAVPASTR